MDTAPLVDVSGLTIDELIEAEPPALAAALDRVLAGVRGTGVLSAFNSALDPGDAVMGFGSSISV